MGNRTRGFEVMKGGETDEGIRVLGINVRSSYFVPANVYRQWRCITRVVVQTSSPPTTELGVRGSWSRQRVRLLLVKAAPTLSHSHGKCK